MKINKLKWGLRGITLCCIMLPMLATILAYQNNPSGLIIPPQLADAMSGNGQAMQQVLPDFSNMSDVKPVYNNDLQFNPETGSFSFSVSMESPLKTPITFNSLSTTITDENGTVLGNVNLAHPIAFTPGENSSIPIEGALSQELITLLQEQGVDLSNPDFNPENLQGINLDMNKIHFTNVNIDIGGIIIHVDDLSPNQLFGDQGSGSTNIFK
ncbi:hypothetical protein MUP59_05020 [Candidatus Bathyarchaeota archaeon]|nr:hypothetical protein [Candidatus Bathyarchaeota archaeon]